MTKQKKFIAVIAGNKKEFDYFVRDAYPQNLFKYISKPDDFRCIRWAGFIKYGTFYDRKDWEGMMDMLGRLIDELK